MKRKKQVIRNKVLKAKIIVALSLAIVLALCVYLVKWWVLIFILPLTLFFVVRYFLIKEYTKIRDEADLTTIKGRYELEEANKILDLLNGYLPKE